MNPIGRGPLRRRRSLLSALGAGLPIVIAWALACGSGTKKPGGSGGTGGMGGSAGGAGGAYLHALLPEHYAPEDFRHELELPADQRFTVVERFVWRAAAGRPFPADLNVLAGTEETGRSLVQIFAENDVPLVRIGLSIAKLEAGVRYTLELRLSPGAPLDDRTTTSELEVAVRRESDGHRVALGREVLRARSEGDIHLTFSTPITTVPRVKLEPVLLDSTETP